MKANKNTLEIDLPNRFVFEGLTIDNYKKREDLHYLHGWRNYVVPSYTELQKLSDIFYDDVNDIVTHDVIDFTHDEVEAYYKSLIPNSVTTRQLRIQLIKDGISLDSIITAINQLPEPDRSISLIEWEYANHFERYNPLLIGIGQILGLTETEVDNIFLNANNIA